MTLYILTLFLHSYLRWVVLAAALWMIALAATGWLRPRAWSTLDERSHRALVGAADLQFTLGAILYFFLSPFSDTFLANPGLGLRETNLRFFGLEHAVGMFLGVSLVHVGRTLSRKASSGLARHRRTFAWTLAAWLVMLGSVPWPFLRHGRPLLRGFLP